MLDTRTLPLSGLALLFAASCGPASSVPTPAAATEVERTIPTTSAPVATAPEVDPGAEAAEPPSATLSTARILSTTKATADGDLVEWTEPPTLTWTAADGATTEVWIGASKSGLVLAARGAEAPLTLEIGSPPATAPEIGFGNQFGEETVTPAYCDGQPTDGEPSEATKCRAWLDEATMRHAELRRWFTRAVRIEGGRVTLDGQPIDATVHRGTKAMEVELPAKAFPMSDRSPIVDLALALGVGVATPIDAGMVGLDVGLSFGDPPNVLEAVLRSEEGRLHFYQPGPVVDHVAIAFNRPMGYQFTPSEPSPYIAQVSLVHRRKLLTHRGRDLVELPRDYGLWGPRVGYAWRAADGALTLLDYVAGEGEGADAAVVRKRGVDLLFASSQTQSPLGTGACGACPVGVMRVVRIEGDRAERIAEEYAAPGSGEEVSLTVDPRGRKMQASFDCAGEFPTKIELVFEPKTETYVRRHEGAPGQCAY